MVVDRQAVLYRLFKVSLGERVPPNRWYILAMENSEKVDDKKGLNRKLKP